MSFQLRLKSIPETWPEMEQAAEERFWDAYSLAVERVGNEAGAVYLFGYVAEILIKVAYFRVINLDRFVDTSKEWRQAPQLIGGISRGSGHGLRYWLLSLERQRVHKGLSFDPAFRGYLENVIRRIESNWDVCIRYRSMQPTREEFSEVIRDIEWLYERRRQLWS